MTLCKGNWEFNFDSAVNATLLGEEATKDHSKLDLVDFVVEYESRYLFVEVVEIAGDDVDALKSDALCDGLARKYRDSMFFHSYDGRTPKAVEYAVLLPAEGVDGILIMALQDELKRRIPFSHPVWKEDSAESCSVMNAEQWKKRYGADSLKRADTSIEEMIE